MSASRDLDTLLQLQSEIERFLNSLDHPILVEDDVELFDLTAAGWQLTVEFGKLVLKLWNPARSMVRRLEEIAYRDHGRLGIFVRKAGGRGTGTLEFRDLRPLERHERGRTRAQFRRRLESMLERDFRGWKFQRVSNRSDREHSLSAWYTRGLARLGRSAWAFLALDEAEAPAAAEGALAFGLIWLDCLRRRPERIAVSGLKLFLPPAAVELNARRAAWLNPRALQVEIFAWTPDGGSPQPADIADFGNVETRLIAWRQGQALIERHAAMLRERLGEVFADVDLVPDVSENFLSLRVHGLEIARVEGQLAPRVFFGLEGNLRKLDGGREAEFREFAGQVVKLRSTTSPDRSSGFYRLQAERWLESLLVKDVSKIDPALSPEPVYSQVPAFRGCDRGVIDVLGVTRHGRLAVIELKVEEAIHLPLQALDYWLRVKWLSERKQFHEHGYFANLQLSPLPPLLYLVSPAFRFHSTIACMTRYLNPAIEIIQVGVNDSWRGGLRVLFRRPLGSGR